MRSITRTPNHTGSNPSPMMTGVMRGTVAIIMERVSMNIPSTR